MSFLSYAQNFEDVLLWRALGHIEQGTYVDIGAQDPVVDSVSKAFHLRGWKGVHVEANISYIGALQEDRLGDVVICAAVGTSAKPIPFFYVSGTGLSTGIASIAEEHRLRGFQVEKSRVPVIALSEILDDIASKDVHWMKIDVEGMEADVLESWGDNQVRPWVLVIEATHPNSQRRTEKGWIDRVISRGYHEVHFDGLSRFFVSDVHDDLDPFFLSPPNIFDGFDVAAHHFSAQQILRDYEIKMSKQDIEVQQAEAISTATASDEDHREAEFVELRARERELSEELLRKAVAEERANVMLAERTSAWRGEATALQAAATASAQQADRMGRALEDARQALARNREWAVWSMSALVNTSKDAQRRILELGERELQYKQQIVELTDHLRDSALETERDKAELRASSERRNVSSIAEIEKMKYELAALQVQIAASEATVSKLKNDLACEIATYEAQMVAYATSQK